MHINKSLSVEGTPSAKVTEAVEAGGSRVSWILVPFLRVRLPNLPIHLNHAGPSVYDLFRKKSHRDTL